MMLDSSGPAVFKNHVVSWKEPLNPFKVPEYALYEIHEAGERRLNQEEKPLLVQLNWHKDDR